MMRFLFRQFHASTSPFTRKNAPHEIRWKPRSRASFTDLAPVSTLLQPGLPPDTPNHKSGPRGPSSSRTPQTHIQPGGKALSLQVQDLLAPLDQPTLRYARNWARSLHRLPVWKDLPVSGAGD